MYDLNHILGDFTEEELAEGAELEAAEQVQLAKIQETSGDRLLELQASFEDEDRMSWRSGEEKTSVLISEDCSELVKTWCTCSQFEKDGYGCRHVTAALLTYLEEREGRAYLADSCISRLLEEKTGIKQPYRRGILRHTQKELANLLGKQQASAALIMPKSEKKELLHIECYFRLRDTTIEAELKAGPGRMYVVKSIREFLETWRRGGEIMLGKSGSFQLTPDSFDRESCRLVECLERLQREGGSTWGRMTYSGFSGNDSRYLLLSGSEFDRLMEQVGAQGVFFPDMDTRKLYVSPEDRRLPLELMKEEFGATLRLGAVQELFCSIDYLYWKEGTTIYRTAVDTASASFPVLQLLLRKRNLYVSDKDLPAVCREVLPAVKDVVLLSCEGIDPQEYLPPRPEYRIYLDYPQELMVSCRVTAHYPDEDYPLFMPANPAQLRDFTDENRVGEEIKKYFQAFDSESGQLFFQGDEAGLYQFLSEDIPALRRLGEVFISDRMNRLRVVPVGNVSVGVTIDSGLLELEMKSSVFTKKELAEILSTYDRKKRYHRLKSGVFVSYNKNQDAMWAALAECLGTGAGKNPELMKVPLYRAIYLDEMLKERDGVAYDKSREYRRLLRSMADMADNDFSVPQQLEAVMRDYQKDGFQWLKTLKRNGFGGILADDMGLGKTLQVLAFLLSEKQEGKAGDQLRTLIITPASLVYNWSREIERFTPQLKAVVISGTATQRSERIAALAGDETAEIWITSYDLLKRDIEKYQSIVFANEIVDEAQYIKNQTTNAAKSVRLVNSGFRLALTGTPIENRLSELWSIFDYLMPGFLYTYSRFRAEVEIPVVSDQNEEVMEKIRRMVHPFILRRLKRDVLKELPEKQEETVSVELEGEQRKLYDAHVQRLRMVLEKQTDEEFTHGKLQILAELTKLRQLCCGPELLLENYKGPNAKLETCLELVHQAIDGGHKILLFSQFTAMLDEVGNRLTADGIDYYRIDGSVSKEERIRLVEAFQTDAVPVFCISLKAGGTGLNLTAADIVIHYDPWWNAAAQNQATDRAHRIGQTNSVNVYQLIAADTIEQQIQKLQESKKRLAEDVLSGEGIRSILIERDEVLKLLEG